MWYDGIVFQMLEPQIPILCKFTSVHSHKLNTSYSMRVLLLAEKYGLWCDDWVSNVRATDIYTLQIKCIHSHEQNAYNSFGS